eukprot:Lankesteria_metandrocarpae@DN2003_c0_g1_i1.p2
MNCCGKNKIKKAEAKAAAEEAERLQREAKEEEERVKREEAEEFEREKQQLAEEKALVATEKEKVEALQRAVEAEKERQHEELKRIKQAEATATESIVLQTREIEDERERLNEEREVKMRETEELHEQRQAEQQQRAVEVTALCEAEEAKVRLLKGEQDRIIKERDELAGMRKDMVAEQQYIKDERTKIEVQIKDILALRDASWTTETFEIVKEIHHDSRKLAGSTDRPSYTGTGTGTTGRSSLPMDSERGRAGGSCGFAPGGQLLCCGQTVVTAAPALTSTNDRVSQAPRSDTKKLLSTDVIKEAVSSYEASEFGEQIRASSQKFARDASEAAIGPLGSAGCSYYELREHDKSRCIVCRNFDFDDQPIFL